jgi:hypothetical protein
MEVIINEIDCKKMHYPGLKEPETPKKLVSNVIVCVDDLKVFEATGTDETRHWIRNVYIKATGKTLILQATDGHIATRKTLDTSEEMAESFSYLDRDEVRSVVRMCKLKKANANLDFETGRVTVDGCLAAELVTLDNYIDVSGRFEMITHLFKDPGAEVPMAEAHFNPSLLDRIRKSFALGKYKGLRLKFYGPTRPIRVSGPEAGIEALLMPMRG